MPTRTKKMELRIAAPLKPAQYFTHIRSVKWKQIAREMKDRVGWRCEKCNKKSRPDNALTIHHLHYKTLGHERPEDVMVLCWSCHQFMHSWPIAANDNNQLDLFAANDDFIVVPEHRSTG
jgi:5-methylcytosine-specific restriction endonuclease McrA